MNKDMDAQFLCKDCARFNLCQYYDRRKEDSYICKYFHLSENQNKCGDLISRQAVIDELEKWDWQELYLPIHFKQILDDVPSVENKGEDRPKGHWIYWSDSPFRWECDKCGGLFKTDFNFCPNCGADMRGET